MTPLSTLLVVDPDARGAKTLSYGFEREGYTVASTSELAAAPGLIRSSAPQLAVVALRPPERRGLELIVGLRQLYAKDLPILALGPPAQREDAFAAGATDYLPTPLFVRDVVSAGKLTVAIGLSGPASGADVEGEVADYDGLYYLIRAMAGSGRSGILVLRRGSRKGEVRFSEGAVTAAAVAALQGLPALYQLLLWDDARFVLRLRTVSRTAQIPLAPHEVIDDCERFLRDVNHIAEGIGPLGVVLRKDDTRGVAVPELAPVARLFDGVRSVRDVVAESPFRIFDTLRIVRRLVEAGLLVPTPAATPAAGDGVPQARPRDVTPIRPELADPGAQGAHTPAGAGEDSAPAPAVENVSETEGATITPIHPTAVTELASHPEKAAGEITARAGRRARIPSPAETVVVDGAIAAALAAPEPAEIPAAAPVQKVPDLAPAPTVPEVQLVAPSAPIPLVAVAPAPITAMEPPAPAADPRPAQAPASVEVRARRETPARTRKQTGSHLTPSSAFSALESDFFARESELYQRQSVESFEDLDDPKGARGDRRR